ncbi:MAG TPA: hypothetical protein VF481_20810 [Novosphingobium sp.]
MNDKPIVVDGQIGLESARQAEIDVAQRAGPLAVITLARSRDGECGAVDEGGVERQTGARRCGSAADGEGVAERSDRQVGLVGVVEVRPQGAVDAPAGAGRSSSSRS